MDAEIITTKEQESFNDILNELRESGSMNMFGAPRWLADRYEISRSKAKTIFANWAKTFETGERE